MMAKKDSINFRIATPEKVIYDDQIDKVSLPTELGEITILPGHAPLVANLVPGEMRIFKADEAVPYAVSGGFIEVRPNSEVIVLADAAEHVEEIDVKRAEEAKKRAQELIAKAHYDEVKFADAAAALEESLTRLRVARKKKYRKPPPTLER